MEISWLWYISQTFGQYGKSEILLIFSRKGHDWDKVAEDTKNSILGNV